jgi:hypothetical protein
VPDQPKKQGGSLFLTAVLGLVGAMIPTLVIMLFVRSCEDPVMERNYRYQREKRAKRLAPPEELVPARVVEEVPDTLKDEPSAFLALEEGLLALAPGIYLSVRFLLENGEALSPNELKQSEGVHTIEITVNSEPWDSLKPEDRVDLLNTTFRFIKDHYPNMTKLLRLAYDDGRPAFDMKFGAEI